MQPIAYGLWPMGYGLLPMAYGLWLMAEGEAGLEVLDILEALEKK